MKTRAEAKASYDAALIALVREAENMLDEAQHPEWTQRPSTWGAVGTLQYVTELIRQAKDHLKSMRVAESE